MKTSFVEKKNPKSQILFLTLAHNRNLNLNLVFKKHDFEKEKDYD